MNRNIQSPTKSLSSPPWTPFVTSNNSGFNVIPATNNNGNTLNASIINMSGTQQSPLQQQSFTATIHTTGVAQNQINSNRYYEHNEESSFTLTLMLDYIIFGHLHIHFVKQFSLQSTKSETHEN